MERFNGHKSLCVPVPERIYLKITLLNLKAPPFIPLSFWLCMSTVTSHCLGLFLFFTSTHLAGGAERKTSTALCFVFCFLNACFLNKVTSALWLRSMQVIFVTMSPEGKLSDRAASCEYDLNKNEEVMCFVCFPVHWNKDKEVWLKKIQLKILKKTKYLETFIPKSHHESNEFNKTVNSLCVVSVVCSRNFISLNFWLWHNPPQTGFKAL